MKDLYGDVLEKYEYFIQKAKYIAGLHGFSTIETPILEYTDVFLRSLGEESDIVSKEIYSFEDKGGDSVAMRPEGTAGVMRAIATEGLGHRLPVKLMYYGPMFRYDRPQKGRYRQFHQMGCEYVGDKSPITDALIILLASDILQEVGISNAEFVINTLGDDETRNNYVKAIVKYFSRHIDSMSEDSQRRLDRNPLRILDSKDQRDKEIIAMAPLIRDYTTKESGIYFSKVCKALDIHGINYTINDFLVRGLDYYSHTAFEIKVSGGDIKDSVGGGGRYDKLLASFDGPDASGVGFAFGIERVLSFMQSRDPPSKKVAVISVSEEEDQDAFAIMRQLQISGITAEFIHGSALPKKLKAADKLDSFIAIIIGENEKKTKTLTVKFLRSQNEKNSLSIKEKLLIQFIRQHIQSR
jgi:histidyl-tRNA synthetase